MQICVLDAVDVTFQFLQMILRPIITRSYSTKSNLTSYRFSICFGGISRLCFDFIVLRSNSKPVLSDPGL